MSAEVKVFYYGLSRAERQNKLRWLPLRTVGGVADTDRKQTEKEGGDSQAEKSQEENS